MSVDLDAVVFFGWTTVELDWDAVADWEQRVASEGCTVVWYGDRRGLAVSASLTKHATKTVTAIRSFAINPEWADKLERCRISLGAIVPATPPSWQLACHLY